jgi:hypothetical protein
VGALFKCDCCPQPAYNNKEDFADTIRSHRTLNIKAGSAAWEHFLSAIVVRNLHTITIWISRIQSAPTPACLEIPLGNQQDM